MKRLSKLLFIAVALLLSWTMVNAKSNTVTDGLVAYYPFNGNANDESGNGNNGTPMSNVTLTTGVSGDNDGAYLFGGYDNPGHIYIPNSETLALGYAATISAYVKPTSWVSKDGWGSRVESGGVMCFFAKSHDRSGMVFFISGNDEGVRNFASCSNGGLDIDYQLQGNYLNKWIHIAYVFTVDKEYLYIDGQKVAEKDNAPIFSTMNTQDLYIGKFSDSWYPFNGAIDEVCIYNRALSANEVKELAKYTNSTISAPSVSTLDASNIAATSATLKGAVNPNGASTAYAFWWGTSSSSLDNHNDLTTLAAGTSPVSVEYELTGLSPNTTYYYQIAATNKAGAKRASVKSFTTQASEISFDTKVIMMTTGDVIGLNTTLENTDGVTITWTSDDESIATISSEGVITAVSDGSCNIKATYNNNLQDNYIVFVDNINGSSDGHDYVDLGLPSGTLWAATNVGAESAEEYGSYFQWGEVEEKENKVYDWTTYKYCNGSVNSLNKYCTNQNMWGGENNPDGLKELEAADDVAQSQWGFYWRIPSIAQFRELFNSDYIICLPATYNETKGFVVKSKINAKGIFLPAASYYDNAVIADNSTKCYYWSRTLSESDHLAYGKYIEDSSPSNYTASLRSSGLTVRPVYQGIASSSNLDVSTTQLDFGSVPIGDSRSLNFEIKNNTYEKMNVKPLALQHSDFTVDWAGGEIEPHSTKQVVVTYSPKSKTFSAGELLNVSTASDSTFINIVASSHTGSNELTTKENLVVWLKDGSTTTFVLNEKPIVTLTDNTMKIDGARASAEYNFSDILRLTYDGMFPDDITKELSTTSTAVDKPFEQTAEALVFSTEKEDLHVKVVSMAGTIVRQFTVQQGSTATLPLQQLATGIYVVTVNKISYKISIR